MHQIKTKYMKQLTVVFAMAILAGCFGTEPEKTGKEGKPMPEFSMLLTDSTTRIYSHDFPQKPTVLFYFSPHCSYCKAQTKKIIEDMDMLKEIQFYYISYYPISQVKDFYKEFDLAKYPNITVGLDSSYFVKDYFEIAGFPYIAIYGKDKKLNKSFMGKIYSSQMKKVSEE